MSITITGAWLNLVCEQRKPQRRAHLQKMQYRRHLSLPCHTLHGTLTLGLLCSQ